MYKYFGVLSAIVFLLMSSGCATVGSGQPVGVSKVYQQPYDEVWVAVIEAVESSDLDLQSSNKSMGRIMAKGGVSAFSWGERVAISVNKYNGAISTRVKIVSRAAMSTNVTAKDWADKLFLVLDARLRQH